MRDDLQITLVTHVNNRTALAGDPLAERAAIHFIDNEWLARPIWRLSKLLRGGEKLAWTMADGGRWQGAQVLPADWVAESTRRHVGGAWPNPPIADSGYGYLWFTGTYKSMPVAWAWGYGAQFALLAPSIRVAVATAATEPLPQQLAAQNRAVATVVGRILEVFA